MRFTERLAAAFSGSGKKRSADKPRFALQENQPADSPLVPKRLLTPGLPGLPASSARQGREQLADLSGTGTVRVPAGRQLRPACASCVFFARA